MGCVVGLSGTHGTGKSTILQGVKALGYPVMEAQLSRAAQKALGWDTLKRAQESVDNMWALQDAVLTALDARDTEIEQSGMITLTERSPADLWAYTQMWCARLNIDPQVDSRVQEYQERCFQLSRRYAGLMIVPMTDAIPFVEEPNRADLESRVPVAKYVYNFVSEATRYSPVGVHIFTSTPPNERVEEARKFLDFLKSNSNGVLVQK